MFLDTLGGLFFQSETSLRPWPMVSNRRQSPIGNIWKAIQLARGYIEAQMLFQSTQQMSYHVFTHHHMRAVIALLDACRFAINLLRSRSPEGY